MTEKPVIPNDAEYHEAGENIMPKFKSCKICIHVQTCYLFRQANSVLENLKKVQEQMDESMGEFVDVKKFFIPEEALIPENLAITCTAYLPPNDPKMERIQIRNFEKKEKKS